MLRFPSRLAPCTRAHPFGRYAAAVAVALGALTSLQCTEDIQIGRNFREPDVGANGGGGGSGALPPDAATPPGDAAIPVDSGGPCEPVLCQNTERQCGDCDDDDGDGRIDARDPDCLGPCDDSESDLTSGITVLVNPSCRADCYFDHNAGAGDDGCEWSYRCDPASVGPSFTPTGIDMCAYNPSTPECQPSAAAAAACEENCIPLTPNGCDCFGCCELPANSGRYIWLGGETVRQGLCDLTSAADDPNCPVCTQAEACKNDCTECEICVGKPDLPESCNSGGGPRLPDCPSTRQPCDPDSGVGCSLIEYCITGCCVPLPR